MRFAAALLFAIAALDFPFPFADRVGVAALGLAALALALPAPPVAFRRPALVPPARRQVDDDDEGDEDELVSRDRAGRYTSEGWVEA